MLTGIGFGKNGPSGPELTQLLEAEIVRPGVAPAAVCGVARWRDGRWLSAVGSAGEIARGVKAGSNTVFDLASVTKPIVALTLSYLEEQGALSFAEPIAQFLPELAQTRAAARRLRQLLSHRAGLVPHREFFAPLRARIPWERARTLQRAAQAVRDSSAAPPAVYSDLGYILAGEALQRRCERELDQQVAQVFAELSDEFGSMRVWLARDPDVLSRVAPTEVVGWRGGLVRGRVHDENAWALAGYGSAGHAGHFGTVGGLLSLGCACLDALAGRDAGPLTKPMVERVVERLPGGSHRTGFDGIADQCSSAGDLASSETFGHLGFTGTSLWCDPAYGIVTVLLTNRVCPRRSNQAIRTARPRVHGTLYRQLG